MRKVLNTAFVISGLLMSVLALRDTTVANARATTEPVHNTAIIYGLHVALPANMKSFPPERVPLP
jgi:hypothetical protein